MQQQISSNDAEKLIADKSTVILDVRDAESFAEKHIPNAIHLNVTELESFCENMSKTRPVLIYCYHGISSQAVAQHLVDQGFESVYSLTGGFEAWRKMHSNLPRRTR